jgi:threonine dehydrogenase-like Zn-dependent dehydrogenase
VWKADIKPGDSVVIFGGGPIGMLALQIARLFSPAVLVLVELDDRKLEVGKKLGATHTINATNGDVAARIMDLTEGLGADAIIECTGSVEPIQQGFSFVGTKGRLVVIGVPTKLQFEIDFLKLLMRDAVFRSSNGYLPRSGFGFYTYSHMDSSIARRSLPTVFLYPTSLGE